MNSKGKQSFDISLLGDVIRDDFGLQIESLSPIDEKDAGDHSDVYFGKYNGQRVFIKIGDEPHLQHFRVEIAAQELFQKHNIPSAKTLVFKERAKYVERPVAIQTAIAGTALRWLNEAGSHQLWEKAGKVLRLIHGIKLKGFGPLKLGGGVLEGTLQTWKENILTNKPDLDYLAARGFVSSHEIDLITNVQLEMSEVNVSNSFFLHNDFSGMHIFTDGDKITGVIDLGGACAGDPRYDIAIAHYYYLSLDNQSIFNKGYGSLALDLLVTKYYLLIAARKLEYRHKKKVLLVEFLAQLRN